MRVPLYRRNARDSHAHMIRHTYPGRVVSQDYPHEVEGLDAEIEGLRIVVRDAGYDDWLPVQPAPTPIRRWASTTCS